MTNVARIITDPRVKSSSIQENRVSLDSWLKTLHFNQVESLGRQEVLGLVRRPYSIFFQGLHEAFAQHYSFTLSPEILGYMIAHEVGVAVKANPEQYRHLFTESSDKQTITIRHDGLRKGNPKSPWHEVLGAFSEALKARFPSDVHGALMPEYSTFTPESRAAFSVAVMDAASPFYDYRVMTMCGIPRIRLLGTPEDYRKLAESAENLSKMFEADLKLYFENLIPVLHVLAEQVDPNYPEDLNFWRSIYKRESSSGGDSITGWITAFVAYTWDKGQPSPKDKHLFDWTKLGLFRGLRSDDLPSHISSVPFIWDYFGVEHKMRFVGGVLGLDNDEGFISPQLSYAVLNEKTP